MVKKKSDLFLFVILVLVLIIGVNTLYLKQKRHDERAYKVLFNKIEYNAKQCYLKKDCNSSMILNDLYTKGYLETLYDPISKEELNKNIIITINNNEVDIKM